MDTVAEEAKKKQEEMDRWIGLPVEYVDEYRNFHIALITKCWSVQEDDTPKYINLVYVSEDESKTDQYGRQIQHSTSVYRKDEFNAAGRHFDVKANLLP